MKKMKNNASVPLLLLLLWGCSPPEPSNQATTSTPAFVASATATPVATPTPSQTVAAAASPLPPPDLPDKLLKSYAPAPLDPKVKESETWWADSGISDNRLGYYTSKESVSQVEAAAVTEEVSFTAVPAKMPKASPEVVSKPTA